MSIRRWSHIPLFIVLCLLALSVGVSLSVSPGRAQEDAPDLIAPTDKDTCLMCHGEKVDGEHLSASAHGSLNCQDCHKGINQYPHPDNATFKPQCTTCHGAKSKALSQSVHGASHAKGKDGLPNCQSCHGGNPHEIVRPTALSAQQQEASCRSCHADKAKALQQSVHAPGKKDSHGQRMGCLTCHGGNPHAIRPPAKEVSAAQDAACQQCHAADTEKMLNSAHGKAIKSSGKQLNCLTCHGDNPHAIAPPTATAGATKAAMCEKCHTDKAATLNASVHGNTDMQGGDRPSCLTCHGERLHEITPTDNMVPAQKDAACKTCHQQIAKNLAGSVHGHAKGTPGKPAPSCLSCHGGGNPHDVAAPSHLTNAQKMAACETCHSDLAKSLKHSVHNRPDKQPGDHPTCLTCHGGSPHGIEPPKHLTPVQKVELCARCHRDEKRMARYGRVDAVEAYERTNHGRAILKLHETKQATCVDCHGLHGIMAADDPQAPTSARHAAQICAKCHKGKKMDFAFSYASHMRLTVERSIVTPLEAASLKLLGFSPVLLVVGLLLLVVLQVTVGRAAPSRAGLLLDLYDQCCLLGGIAAVTVFVAMRTLTALDGMNAHTPKRAAVALLVLVIVAQLAKRLVFRRQSANGAK